MKALKVEISGAVQGVGYRYWLSHEAKAAGLSGWARNTAEGAVEAVLAGDDAAVARVVAACRSGPPAARVARVTTEPAPDPGFADFRILPDRR